MRDESQQRSLVSMFFGQSDSSYNSPILEDELSFARVDLTLAGCLVSYEVHMQDRCLLIDCRISFLVQ